MTVGCLTSAFVHAQQTSELAPPTFAPGTTSPAKAVEEVAQPSADAPDNSPNPADLLPLPASLSSKRTSVIGGRVEKMDRIRDRITLRVFGAGKITIFFDPRTHIYKDGREASVADLRQGDRVSIDTVLEDGTVVARNIRLNNAGGETQGVVVGVDGQDLTLRDALSPRLLKLSLSSQTGILDRDGSAFASALVPGTLVAVTFGSQKDGHAIAQQISVLAVPGKTFTFAGRVTTLDLRAGLLVLTSTTDGKTYEITFDPANVPLDARLRASSDIIVQARYDGNHYVAQRVTLN